eukprot:TRINITY_DN10249_c0_g1_i1.p1 TRINITY_DN10249_c0_g1~~TRINITY_DN10249_c0_g1_i1.p1  ORF type:complete len:373 (-),score=93.59 TRINITY_DN10249_c0_g1_i1:19-1137(-)
MFLFRNPTTSHLLQTSLRRISNRAKPPGSRHREINLEIDENEGMFMAKPNTVINICPQGFEMILERLGKFERRISPGWFFAIPIIDRIAYVVDTRERAIRIIPQDGITRDNVSVRLSGNLYLRFVDVERAAYGHQRPVYAVSQMAQAAMRAGVGKMDLDEIFHNREALNIAVLDAVREAASKWGCDVFRYEVTDVRPDPTIQQSMDLQAAAERDRRSKVIEAEGIKQATVLKAESESSKRRLESEGLKIALVNEAEGRKREVVLNAEAFRKELQLIAEGSAAEVLIKAKADAQSIRHVAKALAVDGASDAMGMRLTNRYLEEFGAIGQRSKVVIVPPSSGGTDFASLIATSTSLFQNLSQDEPKLKKHENRT